MMRRWGNNQGVPVVIAVAENRREDHAETT
jgi:hypothetical protein